MQITKAMEQDLSQPLSDEELVRLDEFLLERVDETADEDEDEDRDEGILGLSELDGFLTAIVSGPQTIMPSVWLPAVWGECAPNWETEDEALGVFTLMMRHMNAIAAHLMEEPGTFEPIFLSQSAEGAEHVIVEEWCLGYVRGLALSADDWHEGGKGIESLLQPIFAFGTPEGWQMLDRLSDARRESLQQEITSSVRGIHDFWLKRRGRGQSAAPLRKSSPRVGRNNPCPCGSGKKYKHCCLH